ncbi:MAG: A/G-specific adenine glycosylase [Bacteroidales bacterium]|nr:A/G-specific adenine glycosylase [Bacteroidales bacterium]
MKQNKVSELIISWYKDVKRDLPWRNTSDPYLIWISEIVLQQTRVAQGIGYYLRFVERFPNVVALANATEDEVLNYWQGLGYYSRARNLHAAAIFIMEEHKGIFPTEYKDVLKLKGVGGYTAAAICSFAYNLPYSVVDGNVYRVLSRLFDVDLPIDGGAGKRYFADLAQELLTTESPAIYNQAIMEFGAMQCVPSNPNCENCPLQERCLGYANKRVSLLPVKKQKTVVKNRYFNYFRIRFGDYIYLQKRTENDIWQNLYEFPLIETSEILSADTIILKSDFQSWMDGIECVEISPRIENVVHVLSHRRIITSFYDIVISNENEALNRFIRIKASDFDQYAVSRLIELLVAQI